MEGEEMMLATFLGFVWAITYILLTSKVISLKRDLHTKNLEVSSLMGENQLLKSQLRGTEEHLSQTTTELENIGREKNKEEEEEIILPPGEKGDYIEIT